MPTRNPDKNKDVLKDLEKTISPVLVVNNSSLKPYVELFEYEPENIYQQPLGSLVGFFEVKDYSEESAYVVNFLTSVLKKEYYINPKRQVTESLDSALHKVNMALSELAKNGNVEWLGKIHAAICVLEKNNAHFSVSGNAKIFLYRNQALSEISADLASDSLEPHPLKTFVNVSSGRLEKDDRLLITSEDIFHILPALEIKKNFQRFQGDKFVQFLKTALSNQMEMIASIVVDMTEAAPLIQPRMASRKKAAQVVNAFSETSYASSSDTKDSIEKHEFAVEQETEEQANYTDKKTGHIYIQGEAGESSENSNPKMALYLDLIKEKISQGSYVTRNEIRKRFSLYKKQLAKKKEVRLIEKEKQAQLDAEENKRLEEERVLREIQLEEQRAQEKELARIQHQQKEELQRMEQEQEKKREQLHLAQEKNEQAAPAKQATDMIRRGRNKIHVEQEPEEEPVQTSSQSRFLEKLRLARLEQQNLEQQRNVTTEPETTTAPETETQQAYIRESSAKFAADNSRKEKLQAVAQQLTEKTISSSKSALAFAKTSLNKISAKTKKAGDENASHLNITPQFSKIGRLFSRFSTKQKLYAIGALALIFIAPLFIVHFLNKPEAPIAVETKVNPPTQAEILAQEKNMNTDTSVQTIYQSSSMIATLVANGNPTVITKTAVVILQDGQTKEFALPTESGSPIRATYMNDLSLILILTDSKKVVSFSPISTKFTDNKIDPANISPESFVGTYLTYLYVLDQKTNQIYRFPRAEGGFGASTNWLKDETSLADVSDMTIDDNIYAVQGGQVLKFFKGQKQPFTLEASNTPIHFDKIFTTPEMQSLYALDIQNSRLISFSKDGSIIKQFQNETLKDGMSLSIDEQNKIAYIGTSSGLISLSL